MLKWNKDETKSNEMMIDGRFSTEIVKPGLINGQLTISGLYSDKG